MVASWLIVLVIMYQGIDRPWRISAAFNFSANTWNRVLPETGVAGKVPFDGATDTGALLDAQVSLRTDARQ